MCYWILLLDIDYVSHFLKKNLRGMMIRCKKQRLGWVFGWEGGVLKELLYPLRIPSIKIPSERSPKQKPLAEDFGSLYYPIYWGLS